MKIPRSMLVPAFEGDMDAQAMLADYLKEQGVPDVIADECYFRIISRGFFARMGCEPEAGRGCGAGSGFGRGSGCGSDFGQGSGSATGEGDGSGGGSGSGKGSGYWER